MSQLSHDIHDQELLARSVVEELRGHAQTVRNLHTTSWEAASADAFRRALEHLAHQIDSCRGEADELVDALSQHARQVGANETAISSFVQGLESGVAHVVDGIGKTAASAWQAVEEGAQDVEHTIHAGAETTWQKARPVAEAGATVLSARTPW